MDSKVELRIPSSNLISCKMRRPSTALLSYRGCGFSNHLLRTFKSGSLEDLVFNFLFVLISFYSFFHRGIFYSHWSDQTLYDTFFIPCGWHTCRSFVLSTTRMLALTHTTASIVTARSTSYMVSRVCMGTCCSPEDATLRS